MVATIFSEPGRVPTFVAPYLLMPIMIMLSPRCEELFHAIKKVILKEFIIYGRDDLGSCVHIYEIVVGLLSNSSTIKAFFIVSILVNRYLEIIFINAIYNSYVHRCSRFQNCRSRAHVLILNFNDRSIKFYKIGAILITALMIPPTMTTTQYVTLTHRKQSSLGCHHFLINHSKKSHGAIKNLIRQHLLFRFGFSNKTTDGAFTPTLLVSIPALTPTFFISLWCRDILPWYEFEMFESFHLVEPLKSTISFSIRWDLCRNWGRRCFPIGWIRGAPGSECVSRKSMVYSVVEEKKWEMENSSMNFAVMIIPLLMIAHALQNQHGNHQWANSSCLFNFLSWLLFSHAKIMLDFNCKLQR